ncbi:hypothetical protein BDB00DRAFT_575408 [Zychaea mexicana]|uniref:uncharacterized protein n=1 Tax=Zychaea mexicana TaxID=64656 RepID=UPI0022FDC744|nr:uncharacterized protein BDB00DRAFT_575408 [Zychaea mexicana]KAI9489960.1 hypothetical protein BDB00DRAFT_575408 [Zychaea mexicana]
MQDLLTSINFVSIAIGASYLYLVNILMHFGLIGDRWSDAMDRDKGVKDWVHKTRPNDQCGWDQCCEFALYAVQTFFVMGMMNLAQVDCYNHAFQLGLFSYIAYTLPDIYRSYIWEGRPTNLLAIKAIFISS